MNKADLSASEDRASVEAKALGRIQSGSFSGGVSGTEVFAEVVGGADF